MLVILKQLNKYTV